MKRRALTLLELLVVLGILTALLALLLPAVQKVRAAADRLRCANNLRQIGVALHVYHNDHNAFPPGVTSARPNERFPRMSWLARILPNLEEDALWLQTEQAYRQQRFPFVNPPHVGLATVVRTFGCPSDERMTQAHDTHNNRRVALTSYIGILGTDFVHNDGVLFVDSRTRLTAITDGTSNTVMVGERPASADAWYGWWYAGVGQAGSGSPDMLLGVRELNLGAVFLVYCGQGPHQFRPGELTNVCDVLHFWSVHPNGTHFLFADGSVRFLRYDVNPLLPALATRAGGEPATWVD